MFYGEKNIVVIWTQAVYMSPYTLSKICITNTIPTSETSLVLFCLFGKRKQPVINTFICKISLEHKRVKKRFLSLYI